MAPSLRTIDASASAEAISAILTQDGAVIVTDALSPAQLAALNGELDTALEGIAPGLRHPTEEFFVDFYGKKTIRLDGLPARSRTFWSIMEDSFMTRVADHLLLENCDDYLLNTGQLIQIGPGEKAQMLHRDEDAWPHIKAPRPLLQVEAMFALTDFTKENGCTQVVPGSHRWDLEREARPEEIGRAEMAAGSALLYLGSTVHGGGANTTTDQWRRGMFFGFIVGWLRTEENTFLTVPLETARQMPRRAQELLGYKAHRGIGVVDVGSPMVLLG
jgi:ectoine hydroxylase-related dioxygenase (phytanoyl-CoA dioxygenase family)